MRARNHPRGARQANDKYVSRRAVADLDIGQDSGGAGEVGVTMGDAHQGHGEHSTIDDTRHSSPDKHCVHECRPNEELPGATSSTCVRGSSGLAWMI